MCCLVLPSSCALLLTIQFALLFFYFLFFSATILSGSYLWNHYSQRLQIECAAWSCGLILHCCLPPDLSQDDLEILQSKYAQLSLALEESLYASSSHRRGPSPAFASHRVVSPSDAHPLRPDSSSLHGPRLSSRPRSLLKTVRVQGTTTAVTFVTVAVRKNAIWNDSFLATRLATVEGPVHGDHLLLNDWNFSQESHSQHQMRFASRRSPSQHQMRFASRGSPSPGEWDSHQGGHPLQSEWDSHQEGHPLQSEWDSLLPPSTANGIRFKGVPFSTAHGIRIKRATLSKANGIPTKRVTLSKRMGFASRGSPSPKRMGFASGAGPSCSKRPLQGILLQGHATQGIPFLQRASPLCLSEWDSLQVDLLLPNDNVLSRGTQILLDGSIHPELRLVRLQLRDPSRGLLPPILIHLHEKIRKLKSPLCQSQLRP